MTTSAVNTATPPVAQRPVRHFMASGLVMCFPSAQLPTLAGTMIRHQVHAVVVRDPTDAVTGVVEAFDVVLAAVSAEPAHHAGELAHRPVTIEADAELGVAARAMADHRAPHLLVTEPDRERVVGMCSTRDIAAAVAGLDPVVARVPVPGPARPSISRSRLDQVRAGEVMHVGMVVVRAEARAPDVARAMVDHHIHAVGVRALDGPAAAGEEGPVWLVTDLDLAAAVGAGHLRAAAGELGPSEVVAADANETLDAVGRVMAERRVTHVLVTDGATRRPVGVISTHNILSVVAAAEMQG